MFARGVKAWRTSSHPKEDRFDEIVQVIQHQGPKSERTPVQV